MRCTMIVVGSEGTADGSVVICHNHEALPAIPQRLDIVLRKAHAEGETRYCGFETIPQVPVTHAFVGDRYWPEPGPQGDFCSGVNEWGVTITCNGQSSREPQPPAETGIPWHFQTELPMERAKTAREAVDLLGWLVDTYHCPPNPDFDIIGGESSWVVADQTEAWYIECSYRHWVARTVRPGELLALCNRYSIDGDFDLASADVVSYAKEQGWYDADSDGPFSWKDAYGIEEFQNAPVYRHLEAGMRAQLEPKWGSITLEDCFAAMRDHGEGTPLCPDVKSPNVCPDPDQETDKSCLTAWRPLRPYCSALTCASFVYHLRSDLPPDVGVTMWYHMATSCSSGNVPIFPGVTALPAAFVTKAVSAEADEYSAWWRFKTLATAVDGDFPKCHPIVNAAWTEFERDEFNALPAVEGRAAELLKSGQMAGARDLLSDFTIARLEQAYRLAVSLQEQVAGLTGGPAAAERA